MVFARTTKEKHGVLILVFLPIPPKAGSGNNKTVMRIEERTIYQYAELPTEKAKERAREWYRTCIDENDFEFIVDDFAEVCAILGVTPKTREVQLHGGGKRQDPCFWWSGFGSQGDGASFEGDYAYTKGSKKAIREYAPTDEKLHRIADELQRLQARYFYTVTATITASDVGWWNMYVQSGATDRNGYGRDLRDTEEHALQELLRDLARWFYRQLESQNDYLYSDEAVIEAIEANDYDFDVDGHQVH